MKKLVKCFFIFILSFNILSSNENVVKTSELELVLFKMAYESLLQDVHRSKESSTLNEKELETINKKIEVVMNELFKEKRVLVKDIDETSTDFNLEEIKKFNEEIALLKQELSIIKQERRKALVSSKKKTKLEIIPIEKEEIEIEPIKVVRSNFKELYNSKKFHALKCFDYEQGSTQLSSLCKEKITSFISKNKKALRFELIPIMSTDDNTIFNEIQFLLDDIEESTTTKVNSYLKESLSRYRVINALEHINTIDNSLLITTANYYVKSKNLKGIVFRAYYKD